jgi:hypothetical protein
VTPPPSPEALIQRLREWAKALKSQGTVFPADAMLDAADALERAAAHEEYARIRAHLGLTYTDREVDDLMPARPAGS